MEYQRDDDALMFVRTLGGYRFRFRAERIRQERTGVHARLSIALNGVILAWGYLNVDRDEDRVRFTNSAYKMVTQDQRANGLSEYPSDYLRKDLNDFCAGLWDAQIETFMPELFAGAETREGPAYLINPYALRGGGTIIYGPPGRGKSYILIMMAVCVDAGLAVPWEIPNSEPVLLINLERSARSLAQRIGNVNHCLGLPRNRPLHTINARGRSLEDVLPAIRKYTSRWSIRSIFLDSLSRAGAGDLRDPETGNKIADRLNAFESWVALGHTPRTDDTHIFGTQMFDAACDLTVRLSSQQEGDGPLGVGLELDKRNDVPYHDQQIIALEFDALGLTRIRAARRREFPDVESGKKMSAKQRIREFILDQESGKCDASTIAETLDMNRSHVARLLNSETDTFTRLGQDGHKVYFGVLKIGGAS